METLLSIARLQLLYPQQLNADRYYDRICIDKFLVLVVPCLYMIFW